MIIKGVIVHQTEELLQKTIPKGQIQIIHTPVVTIQKPEVAYVIQKL